MEKKFITIKIGINRYRKVFLDDILYCKADRAYSIIQTKDSKYTFCEPLKNLESLFEMHDSFLHVNRSFIVNLTKCIEFKTGTKSELIIENGAIILPNQEALEQIMIFFNLSKN